MCVCVCVRVCVCVLHFKVPVLLKMTSANTKSVWPKRKGIFHITKNKLFSESVFFFVLLLNVSEDFTPFFCFH